MRVLANASRAIAIAGLCLALSVAVGPQPASAQEVSPEQRAELEAAFAEILKDPTNLDKTYEYAKLATAYGDYEAAITSYERLLLFNPDLPRIKAELGVLYYRLGSFDVARSYLEQALAEGDPPLAARQRIESFLARINDAETQHSFSGSVTFGLRYQSNANYGPDGDILAFGVTATPTDETEASDDFNFFVAASARYIYDFQNDAGDFFAVEAAAYGARQFDFTDLDIEHFRLKAGPGFRIYPKDSGPAVLRPNVRATYIRLDDESYNFSFGAGFDFDWQAFDETGVFFRAYGEARDYERTEERANAETQDGGAARFTIGAMHRLSPNTTVRGEIFGGVVTADEDFESYEEAGAALNVNTRFDSPFLGDEDFSFLDQPWNFSATARFTVRDHDAANPIVAPINREDEDIRIEGTVAAPVGDGWSVFTTLGYQNNASNIPNNDFDNFSASIGANFRF